VDNHFDNVPAAVSTVSPTQWESLGWSLKSHRRRSFKRKVALLGTGYIAEWHARAISSLRDVELVAVCDQATSRARTFAEKFGVPRTYSDLSTLLAGEELDSVHVLLPPDAHFEAVSAVLDAGVNAFVEKPMCLSAKDGEKLTQRAAERGLRVGVGHNFLFAKSYELLRDDLLAGILGSIDHLTIRWHRELPQLSGGPFDIWMLGEPKNIMLEIGSHCVAQMLDLVGTPDSIRAQVSNRIELPSGREFFRRWQVSALKGSSAIDLGFSFVRGFGEFTIEVRGSLASATADLDRDTYTLRRHRPLSEDFDRYAMVVDGAKNARRQARRTLLNYALSKLHLRSNGTPYGASIAAAMRAFYATPDVALDERIGGQRCTEVIRICEEIGRVAKTETGQPIDKSPAISVAQSIDFAGLPKPRILVFGATGFIGGELTRRLIHSGHRVRVMVRSPGKLQADSCNPMLECLRGDLNDSNDLRRAMVGIDCVYHLARANVKSWDDYQRYEIGVTRAIAEGVIDAGVKRLIYTGTIDSYYAGARAGTITEETPLDPRIERRNPYARAKAASEELLLQMHRERGLPLVIMRPGIVLGRGGSPMHWGVGRWWYGAVCETWGNGRNPLPLVTVQDVADGLIAALDAPGIEGESFNLVADPSLCAQDYLDEIDRFGRFQIRRYTTPILKFYLTDMFKWAVKVITRYPDRQLPSYRDWDSRRQQAVFDCAHAKERLGWKPTSDRGELIRKGIHEPMSEILN
jgi:predicted dehydrogenase/nucleoside-diphosphate-sugar epimerase